MDDDFNAYLKRYCEKERCTLEEAKEHAIVKEVKRYYDEVHEESLGRIE